MVRSKKQSSHRRESRDDFMKRHLDVLVVVADTEKVSTRRCIQGVRGGEVSRF